MDFYIQNNDQQLGPFNLPQLHQKSQSGELTPETLVWTSGMDQWKPANTIPGLFGTPSKKLLNSQKALLFGGAGCGLLILLIILGTIVFALLPSGLGAGAKVAAQRSGGPAPYFKAQLQDAMKDNFEESFNEMKQGLFQDIHPVGTARKIVVHDVTIDEWGENIDTFPFKEVKQYTVRFTLYWEGPLEKDGYTKVLTTFDAESGRWSGRVLSTNGTTNGDVGNALSSFAGALIFGALQAE